MLSYILDSLHLVSVHLSCSFGGVNGISFVFITFYIVTMQMSGPRLMKEKFFCPITKKLKR